MRRAVIFRNKNNDLLIAPIGVASFYIGGGKAAGVKDITESGTHLPRSSYFLLLKDDKKNLRCCRD